MIHLENIHKTYRGGSPLHVLKGVSLDVAEGELVSIMGASGSGKSTLLNILGLLDTFDSGVYTLAGVSMDHLSERRAADLRNRMIGFVFQSFNLIPFKTALETWPCLFSIRGWGAVSATVGPWNCWSSLGWTSGPIICRGKCRADRSSVWP